jgi:hypothetical protein
MFLGSKVRRARRADNLTPSVIRLSREYEILKISQPTGLQGLLLG